MFGSLLITLEPTGSHEGVFLACSLGTDVCIYASSSKRAKISFTMNVSQKSNFISRAKVKIKNINKNKIPNGKCERLLSAPQELTRCVFRKSSVTRSTDWSKL